MLLWKLLLIRLAPGAKNAWIPKLRGNTSWNASCRNSSASWTHSDNLALVGLRNDRNMYHFMMNVVPRMIHGWGNKACHCLLVLLQSVRSTKGYLSLRKGHALKCPILHKGWRLPSSRKPWIPDALAVILNDGLGSPCPSPSRSLNLEASLGEPFAGCPVSLPQAARARARVRGLARRVLPREVLPGVPRPRASLRVNLQAIRVILKGQTVPTVRGAHLRVPPTSLQVRLSIAGGTNIAGITKARKRDTLPASIARRSTKCRS